MSKYANAPQNACPVCGHRSVTPREDLPASMIVCDGCAEILYHHELVKWASNRTRRAYFAVNPEAESHC